MTKCRVSGNDDDFYNYFDNDVEDDDEDNEQAKMLMTAISRCLSKGNLKCRIIASRGGWRAL